MPMNSKPIIGICGSRSIKDLNLDLFLNPSEIGEIVTGGAAGVDTIAETWAKRHKIEWICYLPQYEIYGSKYAPLKRDEQIAEFVDKLIAFWDNNSNGTKYTIEYAKKLGVPVELHLIEER